MRNLLAAIALALSLGAPASASPVLSAGAGDSGTTGNCIASGSASSTGAPIGSTDVCSDTRGAGSSLAVASIGSLGAEANAQEFGASNTSFGGSASYSDIVVFSGAGADPIPVRLNLHFSGSLDSTPEASASVRANASIAGASVGSLTLSVQNGVPVCPVIALGGLGGCATSYDASLLSASIMVPLNVPVSISLSLDANASAFGFGTSGTSRFSNTFRFSTTGPLFELPDGYTANSQTSLIVDNQFPLPEPSTIPLIAAGLLALVGFGRIRRRAS